MQPVNGGDYYRQLFDDAPVMYVITTKAEQPTIHDVNQQFLTRLGYTHQEVVGQEMQHFYSATSVAKFSEGGYHRALNAEFEYEERELISATGEIVPTILKALPLYDGQGNVIGTKAMYVDMTRQKATERALRAERNFSDTILDTVSALVLVVDQQGRIVRFNQACETTTGYRAVEVLNHPVWEVLIPPEQKQAVRERMIGFSQENNPAIVVPRENELLTKQGERKTILWTSTRIFDDAGTLTHVINTGIDLTLRRNMEIALSESESRFRQLAENIEAVFYVTQVDEIKILYVSPSYERIWRRTCQSLYDSTFTFIEGIHIDDRPQTLAALERQKQGEETAIFYRVVQPSGDIRWVRDRAFPVCNEAGEVYRIVGIAEDVTEQKTAEHALQRRLGMESLVGEISKRFVNASLQEIDAEINACLAQIGRFVDIDRSYLIQVSQAGAHLRSTHEWRAPGVLSLIETMPEMLAKDFAWWMERMQRGEVLSISNISQLPADAENERASLNQLGIQSTLVVPLFYRDRLQGFLGFDAVHAPKQWDEQDTILLKLIAEVIVNALQRRNDEEMSRRNDLRLSLALEGAADGLFDYDIEAETMYTSPRLHQLLGYQGHEDELWPSATEIERDIHPDDRESTLKVMRDTGINGGTFNLDLRIRLYNGVYQWFNGRGGMRIDPLTNRPHLAGFLTDISEKKLVQEQIKFTAQRLAALNEISRRTVSAATPEELAETTLKQLRQLVPYHAASIVGQDAKTGEMNILSLNDTGCRTNTPLSEFQIRTLQDAFVGGAQQRVLYSPDLRNSVNPSTLEQSMLDLGARSCGIAPLFIHDKLIGVLCLRSLDPNAFSQTHLDVIAEVADLLAMGIQQRRLDQEIHAHAEKLEQRVRERTSELSLANAELERASRLKDDFLANMSHELRTPLNAILGKVELMQQGIHGPLTEKQARSLAVVRDSGLHLLSLINDILDLSKIEAGKLTLDLNMASVASLCRSSLVFVQETAQKKQISLKLDVDNRLVIQCDERRLKQILVNLLSNAVKFTPEFGSIGLDVNTDAEHNVVHFTVWDTGIGIAPDQLTHLFQPFVQLDSSFTRQHSGTGLGLSLVRRLSELHGGSVAVESSPGQGSRFTISLPWHSVDKNAANPTLRNERAPTATPALPPSPIRSGSILLVDDNEINLALLNEYLSHAGYRITLARSGKECIQRLEEEHFDLILMDVQMPSMDGLEATRYIRTMPQGSTIPIIALTALAMPGDHQKCLDAGMNDYVTKPLPLRKLKGMIAEYLGTGD